MKRIYSIILCTVFLLPVYAAKPVPVHATYNYLSNDRNESQAQAEQHAIERAKQRALENAFGVDVTSVVVSLDTETQQGDGVSAGSDFFSLGGTSVRGEWLTTKDERILSSTHNGEYWEVKVYVSGLAREKSGSPIDLKYAVISQPTERETRPRFFDGEDMLLRFESPVDGALCVYLVDEERNAFCLLPYATDGKGYVAVKANKDSLFFSSRTNPDADELVLTTEKDIEHNMLYIIFSPNTFTKARDKEGGQNWRDQDLPRSLSYEEFLRWLVKNQTADEKMVVRTELIEIRK